MTPNRRVFMMGAAAAAISPALPAHAQAAAKVDPKDAQAVAVGYVADASQADRKKYPNFTAGQACGGCALYQGKAGDAWGGCALFGGRQVAGKGWCSAWAKKG